MGGAVGEDFVGCSDGSGFDDIRGAETAGEIGANAH